MSKGRWASAVGCLLVIVGVARAELPLIRLDKVFPLGGAAGSDVLVEISGKDLDGVKTLWFDHPGLSAAFVKANTFKIHIPSGAPARTFEVRAIGRYGISNSRLFSVTHGLADATEIEPNDTPDKAQRVPLNCAINGNSDSNGDDYFRFAAHRGDRVVLECQALRLDSTLRAILVVSQLDGKELVRSRPYYNQTDPLIDFAVPADGDYLVRLYDMTFLGGQPYRLVISNRPLIENIFPPAIQPGHSVQPTVLGRNLPGGKLAPNQIIRGRPMEQLTVTLTAPREPAAWMRFDQLLPLSSASLNARGCQIRPPGLESALNAATLAFADAPVVLEHEPNDTAAAAQPVTLPTVICGRFDRPGDGDWYSFTAKAGEQIAVDLLCERIDRPGDPYVIVTDSKGHELAKFDDHGINFNSLAQFNRDPVGVFGVPANGVYRIFVQDRYRHGGPRYQYVLHIGPARPDFYPVVFHETPSDPSCPVIWRGGSAFYEFCLNRRNYSGPVTVEAEGLPPGLSCPAVHISPQTDFGAIVFTATASAPEWAGAIRLKAWATINGKRVEREVRCSERRWAIGNVNTSRVCRQICLAVRGAAPYGLQTPTAPLTIKAGTSQETTATVQRYWQDFKDRVQLNGLDLPPGFDVPATVIPAGQASARVKLTVAGNVPAGTYSVVLRGDAQVPFSPDPKATNRPNVRVADPTTPLTVIVTPAGK